MHSDFYDENPILKFELRQKTKEQLKQEFFVESQFIDTQEYITEIESHYPEDEVKVKKRIKAFD